MLNQLPYLMLRSLVLTIVIETILAFILKVRKLDLLIVVLVNIMTNPIVTSVSYTINIIYGLKMRHIAMVFLELFAVISEAIVYKKSLEYKKIKPLVLSVMLNSTSFLLGILINKL